MTILAAMVVGFYTGVLVMALIVGYTTHRP